MIHLKPGFLHLFSFPSVQSMPFMCMHRSYACTGHINTQAITCTGSINTQVMYMHGSCCLSQPPRLVSWMIFKDPWTSRISCFLVLPPKMFLEHCILTFPFSKSYSVLLSQFSPVLWRTVLVLCMVIILRWLQCYFRILRVSNACGF